MMFQTSIKKHESGIYDLKIMFNLGYGEKVDNRTFFEKVDCMKYIESSKLTYIKVMFEKYVNHAKILNEAGTDRAFYRTDSRLHSLDKCIRANVWAQDQTNIPLICKTILQIEGDMRNILPSPGNNSFESSKNKMYDIIVFCRNEVAQSNTISIKQAAKA